MIGFYGNEILLIKVTKFIEMIRTYRILLLEFSAGIAGNLIAGWIQQDIWSSIFTPARVIGTIVFASLTFLALTLIESKKSSSIQPQKTVTHIHLQNQKRERALDGLLKNVQLVWIDGYLKESLVLQRNVDHG
ncbi:MAG: hypothetical protein BroJett011_76000 [Chloroflexota bacterium]|nr:MAG: hypothetical protein BroJett011_76000 [Chloroflexota bacterium]